MTKRKILKGILGIGLSLALVCTQGFAVTANLNENAVANTKIVKISDTNKNKLFDSLEEKMAKAADADKMDVIVMFNKNVTDTDVDGIKALTGDFTTKYKYSTIPAMAVTLSKGQINKLVKSDLVKQVEYNETVQAYMDTAKTWFGVTKAVTDFGVTGDGDGNPTSYSTSDVVVAVVDTGIDASHVDLDGGKVIAFKDFVNGKTAAYDDNDHGTHCSSIIAGTGEANPAYKGVAPGAALVGVKVLNRQGSGTMADVAAGIDWCVQNKSLYNIKVISLSLGASGDSDGTDSTSVAVNNAVNAGLVVCVAAGNEGPANHTIGSPGAAANCITVGAMADVGEKGFFQAYFSSRGPTADGRIKPDISAPGYYIMAADANTTTKYQLMSGTSMATPFVAGTAALMLDANPSLSPAQVKSTIESTAIDFGPSGKDADYGSGRLDSYAAIKSAGNLQGTNITVPTHLYKSDSIAAQGGYDEYTFTISDTTYPIAVTLINNSWTSATGTDLVAYLYTPTGAQIGYTTATTRQDTFPYAPTVAGTYKLRILASKGAGSYYFDLSSGATSLTQVTNQ